MKDKLLVEKTSFCIYQFVCSCGTTYIGRTTRRLAERIREHHPSWLSRGLKKPGGTAITAHLVETEHRVRMSEAVIAHLHDHRGEIEAGQAPRTVNSRSDRDSVEQPLLVRSKKSVRALDLPWPAINARMT
ncbi:unnamed protein product [Echinostoma caproni]|uniref:GIY-YIG domain-containing protein n=1 Tax=Echinostoma caproni TaxID=27848 RepID=A0A183BH30_9TREM|nr:unnamed protein product [Echinostoma caproni]